MDPLNIDGLPANALVLVDTAPIIYVLEGHPRFARRFRPLFEAHEAEALQLAVTTVTIAEVMTGPEQAKVMTGPASSDTWPATPRRDTQCRNQAQSHATTKKPRRIVRRARSIARRDHHLGPAPCPTLCRLRVRSP